MSTGALRSPFVDHDLSSAEFPAAEPAGAADATGLLPVMSAPSASTAHHVGGMAGGSKRFSRGPAEAKPGPPTNVYRAKRPAVAALLIVPAALVGLLLFRGLMIAGFGHPYSLGGVIAGSLSLASLPLLVTGLYGLMTGAAFGAQDWGFTVWARPPLAYLMVGGLFVVAAGIAVA